MGVFGVVYMEKKFYWLKLKDDFFRLKEVKKLRKIAGGDTYTIVYLKLQLLSIKTGGVIYYDGTEQNISEQLAIEIDEETENVALTISFLQNHGLIESNSNSDIFVNSVIPLIGKESDSAERVRKHRELQKKPLQCNTDVTKCNTELERREKRKEKEITPPDKSGKADYSEPFENFWALYGKKGNKALAFKQWVKLKEQDLSEIRGNIRQYIASRELQYRLDAERYLDPKNKRWNDTIVQPASTRHSDTREDVTLSTEPKFYY